MKRRNDEAPSSPPLLRPATPVALSAETITFWCMTQLYVSN